MAKKPLQPPGTEDTSQCPPRNGNADRAAPPPSTGENPNSNDDIANQSGGGLLSLRFDQAHDGAAESAANGDGLAVRRRPFVSRHKQAMDHIRTDSTESRRWTVPLQGTANYGNNDSNNNGNGSDSSAANSNSQNGAPADSPRTTLHKLCSQIGRTTGCQSHHNQPRRAGDWLHCLLPASWRWMRTYDLRANFFADAVAGLTVGVMVIPQSMSYAKLAGLPVQYGLYSALVPVYAYALFGSSRQLAVGPVAIVSLLLSTGLTDALRNENIVPGDVGYQEKYNQLAIQTSFLVGVCYIVMGLLRMGFVTIFLSHAVISGFTTGAAVIIGMSQVKYIVGYSIKSTKTIHTLLASIVSGLDQFSWKTFLMGTISIASLVLLKHIGKHYPRFKGVRAVGPLIVTTVSIFLTWIWKLDQKGIPVVGAIPSGLPDLTVSAWTPIDNSGLTIVVISIVIVGFMESIAIAKQLASKHKYEIDSSQELIGLGMANFLGAMFQGYPVTGSFSRSAVNNEAGAKSGVSGLFTATLVGFTLLLLTKVFENLPLNVLAAIVISGVLGLIDYDEAIYLWRVHKFDFMVWLTACLGTMFLGVEVGLAIAVTVSLLIVVYESAYPHTTVLGRLPGTTNYRSIKQYADVETYDGVVIIRIDAPLYFANAQNVRDKVRKYRLKAEDKAAEHNASVKYLILEMSPVSHVDTSALHILEDMHINYRSRGQQLCFSNPSLIVMQSFIQSGLADKIGGEYFFPSVSDAMNFCLTEMDTEAQSLHESVHGNENLKSSEGSLETDVEVPLGSSEFPEAASLNIRKYS